MKKNNQRAAQIVLIFAVLFAVILTVSVVAQAARTISGFAGDNGGGICSHNSTYTDIKKLNLARHESITMCSICKNPVETVQVPHTWETGTSSSCATCGQVCAHAEKTYQYTSNNAGAHQIDTVCKYCKYTKTSNSSAVCEYEKGICKLCGYACPHTDTVTSGGVTSCNGCGNTLGTAYVYFDVGTDGRYQTITFAEGQTWSGLLSAGSLQYNDYLRLQRATTGANAYTIEYIDVTDASRSAYMFYNGERVEATDVIVSGATYHPGKTKPYSSLYIYNIDGTQRKLVGYEEGQTWRTLALNDSSSLWGDAFTLTSDGGVCLTNTGKVIMLDGVAVKATDVIDGTLWYTIE